MNAHLFDLVHKTDTHSWLPKESYAAHPPNFDRGVLYMTSWTSEIRLVYNFLLRNNFLSADYVFLDLGCGKGKACLQWRLLESKRGGVHAEIIGLDYYEPLVKIAQANHWAMFNETGNFLVSDVCEFNVDGFDKPLVVYAYNPFDDQIVANVANRLAPGSIFIYNNPVHSEVLKWSGFEEVFRHEGWHSNSQTTIFKKTSSNPLSV